MRLRGKPPLPPAPARPFYCPPFARHGASPLPICPCELGCLLLYPRPRRSPMSAAICCRPGPGCSLVSAFRLPVWRKAARAAAAAVRGGGALLHGHGAGGPLHRLPERHRVGVHVVPEALLVRRAPYRGLEPSPAGAEGAACSEREERSRCVYGRDNRIGARVEAAGGGVPRCPQRSIAASWRYQGRGPVESLSPRRGSRRFDAVTSIPFSWVDWFVYTVRATAP